MVQPEVEPVSLVPRWVSRANGITVNTPAPVNTAPTLVVPPYTVSGRTRSVRGNVMVDTPAVSVVTPERPTGLESALAAMLAQRD